MANRFNSSQVEPGRIHSHRSYSHQQSNNGEHQIYPLTQAQEFIYSVQCSLYKFDTISNSWINLENSRNCVIQLYKVQGKNIVSASLKRSGKKFFEYSITNKLHFSILDDHLYQLNNRNDEKDVIWGISFMVRNDGVNFANKFEDLIQYEPGAVSDSTSEMIVEENISLSSDELSVLSYPLQLAIENGNHVQGQYWLNLMCRLPESHRKFVFHYKGSNENRGMQAINVAIENLDEVDERVLTIDVPFGITINAMKEIFFIRFGIRRELQRWITNENVLIGKDRLEVNYESGNVAHLIILNHQPTNGYQDLLFSFSQ
eukprot:TRINITY_DN8198_c0_g1_i1.p1 TRINITY_DN8198_c0_g1~~TRINITY_DN8198_c0_g1_i1.p1  ORF type:complete len:324 (+),score=16.44 TRINITY_DN8198_c0_g1_i1:25-972(+)